MLLLDFAFSHVQQTQYFDVNVSEFQKPLENLQLTWFFLPCVPFYRDVNQGDRKKGNLKKPKIDLSRNKIHKLLDNYFPKGVLNTNEDCKCEGQKQY